MSDEKESDSIGPDIDLEKIAKGGNASSDDSPGDDSVEGTGHDDGAQARADDPNDDTHGNAGDESHGHDAHDHDSAPAGRTTAPQSEFTTRQAAIGGLVTLVGVAIAYGVPALLG